MKVFSFGFVCLLSIAALSNVNGQTKKAPVKKTTSNKGNTKPSTSVFTLKSHQDSVSYALAMDIARNVKSSGFDVDQSVFQKAFSAVLKGEKTLLEENQIVPILQNEMQIVTEKKNSLLKSKNADFLVQNKLKPTIKTTDTGLQYEVIKEGDGAQPTSDSEVVVHYSGSLIDGEKFDSSYDRNEPLSLELGSVIEGWKQGIPLMRVGSKYRFYIPYDLGYGERGTRGIPPYSTLIFDVELLEVK